MTAPVTDADRAAAKSVLFAGGPSVRRWIELGDGDFPERIAQAIADAREAERAACVRELRARAAQARSDGWDMVENGLALAAARIEIGVDR